MTKQLIEFYTQDTLKTLEAEVPQSHEHIEYWSTKEDTFCYKLHKLRKACESLEDIQAFFYAVSVEPTTVVIDITELHKSFFTTKGSELFRDLEKIAQNSKCADFLKIIIVHSDFIPKILQDLAGEERTKL